MEGMEGMEGIGGELGADIAGDLSGDMGADMGGDMGGDMSLDMSGIGPDGEQFEGAQDLSQLQSGDPLLGGPLMDENIGDPFVVPPS